VEVLVNDQPYTLSGPADQSLRDLAREICSGPAEDRVVVSIRCDGRPVAQHELEAMLDRAASDFGRLDLQTQPIKALVSSTLGSAIDVFTEADAARNQIADHLAEGQQEKAMALLQELFSAWKQVQDCLPAAAEALHIDLADLHVDDLDLNAILDQIKIQLTEMREAMRTGDMVLVGDILRYELEEPFQNWLGLLKQLHELATTE
jgi:hypothetical protein